MEKSVDVIAPSHAFVNDLEEICISEPDLRFNVPKNMEESKVKFEYKPTFTAQSRRKQEKKFCGIRGLVSNRGLAGRSDKHAVRLH